MAQYAARTEVSVGKTRQEIEQVLARYGAPSDGFGFRQKGDRAMIEFEYEGGFYRIIVPLPDRDSREFTRTPTGLDRSEATAKREWEQACRQRWRALLLVLKALLEAVESGILTSQQAFMPYRVLASGQTIGQAIDAQLEAAAGQLPTFEGLVQQALPAPVVEVEEAEG